MKTVWKYLLGAGQGSAKFQVPIGSELALVAMQGDQIAVWLVVDTSFPKEIMHLRVFGTGEPVPDEWEHVGSVQDGIFVWHVFEELPFTENEEELMPSSAH